MERDYFDAKFDGLEKLLAFQDQKMTNYVGAVSKNVKDLEGRVQAHEKDNTAHGLGVLATGRSEVVAWIGAIGALGLICIEIGKLLLPKKAGG